MNFVQDKGNDGEEHLEPPELFHVLVPRAEWGALPPQGPQTFNDLPARNIRYTFTDTENCYTAERCSKAMRDLQKAHMDKGCSDIMYNFLIGGDGRVYEGRGWKVEGEVPPQFEDLKRETVDIAFIGTFKLMAETNNLDDRMPLVMTEALRSLADESLSTGNCEADLIMEYYDFVLDFKIVEKRKQLAGIL